MLLGLPFTIIALGLTSFFTDVASEMIFPLLPLFLGETLRAGPAFLGLVEGAADTVSSLLKLASGYLADRWGRRKPLILLGYGLASVVRPLMALAQAPWHVLGIRLADRVGKGLRSAPRDALIADAALPGQAGRAFGLHRAMDHAGAVVGPLVASLLLGLGLGLRNIFWCTAVPGALCLGILLTLPERKRSHGTPAKRLEPSPLRAFTWPFRSYLFILWLFCLSNSSDAFLLLRAREIGLDATLIPMLWTALHVSKLLCSYFGGLLSDRMDRAPLIAVGWVIFSAVYLGMALASSDLHVWVLFTIYGLFYGLTEPAEKALVKDLAPSSSRGKAFGYYNFVVGVSALPAGLFSGWLWRKGGALLALGTSAGLAMLAACLLLLWNPAEKKSRSV
jgi:MFS family permease